MHLRTVEKGLFLSYRQSAVGVACEFNFVKHYWEEGSGVMLAEVIGAT